MAITVILVAYAILTSGSDTAVSINIIWGYILFGLSLLVAVVAAIKDMFTNTAGVKKTLLSVILIVVVIGAAIAISASHKGLTIPNSEGGVFDDPFELIITETSIIVTYVAFAAAIVVALYSVVRNALK